MVSANEQTIKETDLLLEDPTNMPLLVRSFSSSYCTHD